MRYEVWSPMGLHLWRYDGRDLVNVMDRAARAAHCETLEWIEINGKDWKLAWPDGAARLYILGFQTTPDD